MSRAASTCSGNFRLVFCTRFETMSKAALRCTTLLRIAPNLCPRYIFQEQECFAKAASLDTHKALVHIFFAQRSTKKVLLMLPTPYASPVCHALHAATSDPP